jgi:TolB-like protein
MNPRGGGGLLERLRERGVLRVAASYVLIAWLVLQIADVVLEPWDLPKWVHRAPLIVALLGFPIAIALAWFFELGGGPPHRDTAPDGVARPTVTGWRRHADIAVISILSAIVAFFVLRDAGWLGDSVRPGTKVESSSIAVLPFANLGGEAERHLSDGLSDELRNQFSRMQSLTVTSRSSSEALRGLDPPLDAVTMAGRLAVATLLEGSVARDRGRLRVAVQLVDGGSGKVLWAERYDRADADLLAVQSEIAGAVVRAVLPRFAAAGNTAPPPPTEDPVAYDLYLLAREKLRDADSLAEAADRSARATSLVQAADLLVSAIRADPTFAQAHAVLAEIRYFQAVDRNSGIPNDQRTATLDAAVTPDIEHALQIDPGNAHAWYVRGRLLRGTERFEASAEAFQRAAELDPNHAAATLALSAAALSAGRQDERFRLATRALALDPMAPANHIAAATVAWILGRRDDLRATVERMRVLFPGNPGVATMACLSILRLGEPDEALACVELERDRFKAQPAFVANLDWLAGETSEAIGRNDWALAFYDRAASRNPDAAVAAMRLRNDVAGLRQHAMEALESGRATNFSGLTMAAAGLSDESVALFRAKGIDRILDSNSPYKPMAIDDVLVLVALLRQRDEAAEADRLLAQATHYSETMRRHGARAAVIRLHAARAYALGGRRDEALEQFAFAVNAMDSPFPLDPIERDPSLAAIRDDTRFETQLQVVRDRQARAQARLPATFARHGLAWTPP